MKPISINELAKMSDHGSRNPDLKPEERELNRELDLIKAERIQFAKRYDFKHRNAQVLRRALAIAHTHNDNVILIINGVASAAVKAQRSIKIDWRAIKDFAVDHKTMTVTFICR